MSQMKAIALNHDKQFTEISIDKPTPTGRNLLVQVMAVAVNPVDTKQAAPAADANPKILGFDVAGIVESVGPDCKLFQPGDEVYYAGDITKPGGNSEYHIIDERIVGKKPTTLSFPEAAAMPLTSITAWEGLFHRLQFPLSGNEGKTVLIVGAAGGVGSIATQLARKAGLTVIGTASRPASEAWVKEHGATFVINHHEPFRPQLEALGIQEVDAVFALNVIDKNWDNICDVVRPGGGICTILSPTQSIDFNVMKDKSLTWSIEFMFTRPKYETPDMIAQHELLDTLSEWIDSGDIVTTLTKTLEPINAANLQQAFDHIRSGQTIGKIALSSFN